MSYPQWPRINHPPLLEKDNQDSSWTGEDLLDIDLFRQTESIVTLALRRYVHLEPRPKPLPPPDGPLVRVNSWRLYRNLSYKFTVLCMGQIERTPGALRVHKIGYSETTPLARSIIQGIINEEMDRRESDGLPSELVRSWWL